MWWKSNNAEKVGATSLWWKNDVLCFSFRKKNLANMPYFGITKFIVLKIYKGYVAALNLRSTSPSAFDSH